MPSRIPVGHDDFRKLREAGLEYVDKSDLIRELLDRSGGQVVLLPRPRRFGKTLNLSMLRCWFEKTGEDLSHLFSDLSIWRAGEVYRAHFQRYPVIHFNFKGSRGDTFERCLSAIRQKIIDLYKEHRHRLSIPNREVREVYSETFAAWLKQRVEAGGGRLSDLTEALLTGDSEVFEEHLQGFVTDVLSYHDPGKLHPERVYHGFLVGLLAALEVSHEVRSNRESGGGRPDVLIRPRQPGQPGVVLELKVARPSRKTLKQALSEGLAQLGAMDYAAELRAAGASPVHAFVVAFDGKVVRVASAGDRSAEPRAKKPGATRARAGKGPAARAENRRGGVAAKARPVKRGRS